MAKNYSGDLHVCLPELVVKAQIIMWLSDIRRDGEDLDLKICIQQAQAKRLPAVNKLLRIFGTACHHCHRRAVFLAPSTFEDLRSYMRATMGEERLTGLALIHAHKDMNINIDSVKARSHFSES